MYCPVDCNKYMMMQTKPVRYKESLLEIVKIFNVKTTFNFEYYKKNNIFTHYIYIFVEYLYESCRIYIKRIITIY